MEANYATIMVSWTSRLVDVIVNTHSQEKTANKVSSETVHLDFFSSFDRFFDDEIFIQHGMSDGRDLWSLNTKYAALYALTVIYCFSLSRQRVDDLIKH